MTRINLDSSGKRATGVTFVDTSGEEWEQPADLVILAAFTHLQRPAAAAVGHRQALRPGRQSGRDRPQLHPPDDLERDRLLRQGQIQLQSVHRLRRDRHVHRRIQRRQFRPRPARLRRRRLHGPGADQRPPDRDDAGAAGHAALGREMEERGARQLSEHGDAGHRRARQLLQLSRRLSRPRPALQGPLRPAADAHDDRLPRQRAEAERVISPTNSPKSSRRWARSRS